MSRVSFDGPCAAPYKVGITKGRSRVTRFFLSFFGAIFTMLTLGAVMAYSGPTKPKEEKKAAEKNWKERYRSIAVAVFSGLLALTAAYSLVCLAGLASELNWRARRWMAPVGGLNIVMAVLWIATLIALATPVADPLAISARSQVQRLEQERVDAADFDYGYLRFYLGDQGEEALTRLEAMTDHPQAERIREGVAAARNAKSYWEYQNPDAFAPIPTEPVDPALEEQNDGPMSLELNPEGADTDPETGDEAPDPAEPEDN